jgi:hypothetical protein
MTDEQWEALKDACVIMGQALSDTAEALRAAVYALDEKTRGFTAAMQEEAATRDELQELLQAMERQLLDELQLADYAEEPADIEPPRKQPRPPKCLGPVNKANYTANRPPRRARSSCYIRRH